jgi:hypothetical protein
VSSERERSQLQAALEQYINVCFTSLCEVDLDGRRLVEQHISVRLRIKQRLFGSAVSRDTNEYPQGLGDFECRQSPSNKGL